MDLYKAVMDFAEYMQPNLNRFDCDEMVLFGSLVREPSMANDIDLMILHHNPALDQLEDARLEKRVNGNFQGLMYANTLLGAHGYPSIGGIASIPSCTDALKNGVFGLVYLNKKFFTDENYSSTMISRCLNPNFYHNVFKTGYLWNPKSKKFDIKAQETLKVPEVVNVNAYVD